MLQYATCTTNRKGGIFARRTRITGVTPVFSAERLRTAMAERGYTQERLAEEVGVTTRAVQKWCAGVSEPAWPKRKLIAQKLKRDPDWFWLDDPEMAA